MITPKFAYFNGSTVVDFTPSNPAVKKVPTQVGPLVAVRHDSITTSGIKQSVTERIDEFFELSFEDVPLSDLASWNAFFRIALMGGQFTYYPDGTNAAVYYDYSLEDTEWRPKWSSWQNFSFSMTLRLFHGTPVYYS